MVKLLWILPFILNFPSLSFSQPFVDIVNLRYQRFPSVQYSDSEKEVSINQIIGNVTLPIPLKNKDVIIVGGTYDQFQFLANEKDQSSLYAINLQLGYLKTWKGTKWKTLLILLPKISSDQLKITSDSYQQGAAMLFTYVKSDILSYKVGLYYNREFFGNFFMPLVGVEWRPNSRLNIYGILPASMNIEYQLNNKLYIGMSYQSITSSYRLHDSHLKSFVRNGDRFWGHNQIRGFLNFYSTKNIVLFAEIGYTFFRKFEAYERKNERIEHPIYRKTNDGMLLNVGTAFRVRL